MTTRSVPERSTLMIERAGRTPARQPWARPVEEMLRAFDVVRESGLTAGEVRQQRRRFGPNRLRQTAVRGAWHILFDQLKGWRLLALAAALSLAFCQTTEGLAISAVGFATELRSARSMDALRRLGQPMARVWRGGCVEEIHAVDVVPGDIVVEGGDVITADIRLIDASKLRGRTIFRNIRAVVLYLLSCNLSEILVVALASLVNAPLRILPLQILFLNLVTDVFPALAPPGARGWGLVLSLGAVPMILGATRRRPSPSRRRSTTRCRRAT